MAIRSLFDASSASFNSSTYEVVPEGKKRKRDSDNAVAYPSKKEMPVVESEGPVALRDRIIPTRSAMQPEFFESKVPKTLYQETVMQAIAPYYSQRIIRQNLPAPFQMTPLEKLIWRVPTSPYVSGYLLINGDFYKIPLDWGKKIYFSSDETADVMSSFDLVTRKVSEVAKVSDKIYSVKIGPDLSEAGIGGEKGNLFICDASTGKINFHRLLDPFQLASIGWRQANQQAELSVGIGSSVMHIDRRQKKICWQTPHESDKICTVVWNSEGTFLASGCNGNLINVYDSRKVSDGGAIYQMKTQAAVKALQWHPSSKDMLMAGAGTSDRHLYLMDVGKNELTAKQNLLGQICDLTWLDDEHVVVGLGFSADESIQIWRYQKEKAPSLKKMQAILGGKPGRVLKVVKSPLWNDICTLSQKDEDWEHISFWNFRKEERIEQQEARRRNRKGFDLYNQVR